MIRVIDEFRRSGIRIALIVLLALAATAARSTPATADEPYEINAILSVTGSEAFLGGEESKTLGIIGDLVNKSGGIGGRQVKFNVQDDQSNPQIAVQLMNGLLAKNVPVVLGSSSVSTCNAMAPLIQNRALLYCFSPGVHPPAGSFMFSCGVSTADSLAATAQYFRAHHLNRVGVITTIDATGQDADRVIDRVFGHGDARVVAHEHFNKGDISVSAQLTNLKAAGSDAIIAWTTGSPLGTILRGAAGAGVNVPIVTSGGNVSFAQMHAYAKFLPKELLFPSAPAFAFDELPRGPIRTSVAAFQETLRAAGIKPEDGNALAWDPTFVVIDALRKLGTNATAEQLRAYISTLRGNAGIFGEHDYVATPQRGISSSQVMLIRWDGQKDNWVGVGR